MSKNVRFEVLTAVTMKNGLHVNDAYIDSYYWVLVELQVNSSATYTYYKRKNQFSLASSHSNTKASWEMAHHHGINAKTNHHTKYNKQWNTDTFYRHTST